jgi:hypothetical protein
MYAEILSKSSKCELDKRTLVSDFLSLYHSLDLYTSIGLCTFIDQFIPENESNI